MPLFNIGFEFNSETKTVANVTCKQVANAITKNKTKAAAVTTTAAAVSLVGSSLQLTQGVVDALNVAIGDKVLIEVNKDTVSLSPSSKGNVLSKKLALTCKGKNLEAIKAIGENFTALESDGVVYLTSLDNVQSTTEEDDDITKSVTEELGDAMEDFDIEFDF